MDADVVGRRALLFKTLQPVGRSSMEAVVIVEAGGKGKGCILDFWLMSELRVSREDKWRVKYNPLSTF